MKICVYGASSRELNSIYYEKAEALGEVLAERGHTMVFGGGTSGLMGAAARGVHRKNGKMIGVAPKFFAEPGILFESCTEMVFTETMSERKKYMEDISDAFITLPGGIGTFEEFFETLTLKSLGRHGKAMAILDINGYYAELDSMIKHSVDLSFTPKEVCKLYQIFTDASELIYYIESYKDEIQELWKTKIF